MKYHVKILRGICAILIMALLLGGYGSPAAYAQETAIPATAQTDDDDTNATWEEASSTKILLEGGSATVQGSGAAAENGNITITAAGTYVLSGRLENGQITINAPDTALVRLVLNGASIHCENSAPIHCQQADKLVIILADGSENTLSDGENYVFPDAETDEPSATLFSKADVSINGNGSLIIKANYNNGIGTKDDLVLVSGNIQVEAANNAIRGRDSVTVLEASLVLTAGNDGIQANNDSAEDKGWIALYGGTYTITAGHDGIQAETNLSVYGGTFTIIAGGGSANAAARTGKSGGFGGGNRRNRPQSSDSTDIPVPEDGTAPTLPEGETPAENGQAPEMAEVQLLAAENATEAATETEQTSSESYKALKAGVDILVAGGSISIDAADDGLHANGNITASGGSIAIKTGDDGLHADNTVLITGDISIDIAQSYEGIEGANVTIQGGNISIVASDDGINAAGGSDAQTTGGAFGADHFAAGDYSINIEGGTISVRADTDGLDSNGDINISGGTLIIHMAGSGGGSMGGDGMLDKDGNLKITGGVIIGAGGTGIVSMGGGQSSASAQQSTLEFYFSQTQSAGTLCSLADASGNVICSFAPEYDYGCVVVSSPELQDGAVYTVSTGGSAASEISDGYFSGAVEGAAQISQVTISGAVTSVMDTGEAANTGGFGSRGGNRPERKK